MSDTFALVQDNDPILREEMPFLDFEAYKDNPQEIVETANAMAEKMLKYGGVGLSANQVGLRLRMFVMRTHPEITVVVNPRIVDSSEEEVVMVEGCLSFPGLQVKLKRPAHIRVRYQNAFGETVTDKLTGLTARVFQHELDHLDGKNFIDRAGPLAKDVALRKWNKLRKQLNLKRKFGYGI